MAQFRRQQEGRLLVAQMRAYAAYRYERLRRL